MLQASDHERRMITYDIHDGPAQQIAAALMQFELFGHVEDKNSPEAAEIYASAMRLLQQGQSEVRRLITGVRTPVLDELGLQAAIADLIRNQTVAGGPEIELHGNIPSGRLAPELENIIYRIVQEGLTNGCKHSKSAKLRITFSQDGDRLRIEVRDWGVGFAPDRVADGRFGLEGIRQRARSLGGNAEIRSAPGKGTRIAVDFPVVGPGAAPARNGDVGVGDSGGMGNQ
jgi:signal transduction histidine kinase